MTVAILDAQETRAILIKQHIGICCKGWKVCVYDNPFAFVTAVYDEWKGAVDLLMIHLAEEWEDSILMGRNLQDFFPHIRLIFYSEDCSCAEAIFQARPSFFLKLPMDRDRLAKALERVNSEMDEDASESLSFRYRGKCFKLRYASIRYMESVGRKIIFHSDKGSFETYMTMDDLTPKLPGYFIRCHRSYLVNQHRVTRCENGRLFLSGVDSVPVSRSYQKEVFNKIIM